MFGTETVHSRPTFPLDSLDWYAPAHLSSLDTLPTSRSREMAAAPSKPTSLENPTEK